MKIIKPPEKFPVHLSDKKWMFLAGSIEMGKAENWQDEIIKSYEKIKELLDLGQYITSNYEYFMNPRRDDWDSSWEQSFEAPQFFQQVNWELNMLDRCDRILMYFDPKTKSPITLLELGLYADSGKIDVICPPGFWRRGNVEIVCDRYKIPFYNSIKEYFKL